MLEWNEEKRQLTLEKRGLDFADTARVFAGDVLDIEDTRKDYGECRMVTITWTQRGDKRRIISMRNANEREHKKYSPFFR